jgi:signal transduction histidine kinase/HPt (histidine-containing phosphotransfer) domain-containing protein
VIDSVRFPHSPRAAVSTLIRRKNGQILGNGYPGGGFWKFENGVFTPDPLVETIGGIIMMMEDREGQLWLGGELGVAYIGPDGYRKFSGNDDLKEVKTNCILQDFNGNIWVGSAGGGATKFSKEAFTLYGPNTPFAKRAVFAILEIGLDHYWVGTEVGLFELKKGVITEIPGIPEEDPFIIDFEKAPNGDIFVTTQFYTFIYRNGQFQRLKPPSDVPKFKGRNVEVDAEGNLFITTSKALYKIVGDSAVHVPLPMMKFGLSRPYVYTGSGSALYFTTDREGLFRVKNGEVRNFQAPRDLPNEHVTSFLEDKNGAVWAGTYDGLACIRGNEVCYLNTSEGLAGNLIYILLEDKNGNLWVGTDFGLSRITLDRNSQPLSIRNYGSEDGFTGLECNQGAGLTDSQGRLWFGTIEGLACYHPERDYLDPKPPYVEITGVQLHLEEVDWDKRNVPTHPWTQVPVEPSFASDENHIRIEFAGVTQRLPEKVKYKYRLTGLDEAYTQPSTENHAIYPFLPPGDYTFELVACNAEGVWTKEPVKFHFVIKAPFYRTIWFGLIAFMATILIVVGIVRIRTGSLQKQRSVLEHKVKQRTEALEQANQVKGEFLAKMSHEIRTPMNGVIGMTDLLERTQLTPQQRKFVENIRVSGHNLLNLINDILDFSRIESGKMELEKIPIEMRHLIEEVMDILAFSAFSKGLEMLYWVDPEIRGPVLGDPARLKQILTNLIGNAIKFTSKGEITVRAKLVAIEGEKAMIQISVRDSGIGIPKEKHATLFESFTQVDASTTRKYGGTGLGLAISYNLSKMMGGQMWVESDQGKGTEFFFTFEAGLSEPWKVPGEAHPAKALEGKKIVMAMQNAATIALVTEYVQHWRMDLEVYDSLEAATDAALDQPSVEFLLVDLRLAHGDPNQFARRMAKTCASRNLRFALFAEPDIAIILQNDVGENGWVLSKPLKRDDLLQALMGQRASHEALDTSDQTQAFAAQLPLRIVVAEDNPINQDVANGMLSSLGYEVRTTVNGQETVDEVMKGDVDVVFMDVQMPVMDGLEATRIIVERLPKDRRPIIIAMTANAMESDRQRCLDAGMDTFISKPFLMGELMKMLRSIPALRNGQNIPVAEEPIAKEVLKPEPVLETTRGGGAQASKYRLTDMNMLDAVSGGEPAFVLGILNKLVVKLPEAVEELRTALVKEDWETLRATAHRTKSSAAYSGSEELKEKFKELEHMAREQQHLEDVPEKLDALSTFVLEVVEELKRHIAERS